MIPGVGKVQTYGPTKLPYLLHKFELWSFPEPEPKLSLDEEQPRVPPPSQSSVKNENEEVGEAGISVVLGAGNQSFICIMDTLQCLFVHPCKPVLIKHHPLRPFLYDLCNQILQPLISRGYVQQMLDEGLELNEAILNQSEVTHIHITGSLRTVEAIQSTLSTIRSPNAPAVAISSELGNVTPVIISPGQYTPRELRNAAKICVTSKKMYAGSNCLATQALILPQDWEQKAEFRSILMEELRTTPTDPAYYPGSGERCKAMAFHYKNLGERRMIELDAPRSFDAGDDDSFDEWFVNPYVVECGVPETDSYDGHALQNEAFGPLLGIVELPGGGHDTTKDYLLNTAIPFLNQKENIYGSLCCSLIYPKCENKQVTDMAIARLRYGTVAINTLTAFGYLTVPFGGRWGAHTLDLTGHSGRGFLGNALNVSNVDKTVIYSHSLDFPLLINQKLLLPSFATRFLNFINMSIPRAIKKVLK